MLYQQTHEKLQLLTQALQMAHKWSLHVPSREAMASTAPFACDVMPLEQWLQFIFIPRMQWLIDQRQSLPTQIAIAPMAEHVWQALPDLQPVIKILAELDVLLNESR